MISAPHALPWTILPGLAADLLLGRRRSFRQDALACIRYLNPPLQAHGAENIPQRGPVLLTVNHYTRPGLPAWWAVLACSACTPVEIHWIMTSALTYPDRLRARLVTPLTRLLLRRLSQVYGFTGMPPMPPDPREVEARARAVRQVLGFARRSERPVIGLAPEGRDAPKDRPGCLVEPPPGAGRFIEQLARCGLRILPAAVWEEGAALRARFGPAYILELPEGLPAPERDRMATLQVMTRLAELLPAALRGPYALDIIRAP